MLYRIALRMTGSPSAAEDLVGLTLYKSARGWDSFDGRSSSAWMAAILRNEFLQQYRNSKSDPQFEELNLEESHSIGSAEGDVIMRITQEAVLSEVDRLPEDFRWPLVLCDIEEMQYVQAAEILNVSVGTISSRIHRARKMVRDRLRHRGWTDSVEARS